MSIFSKTITKTAAALLTLVLIGAINLTLINTAKADGDVPGYATEATQNSLSSMNTGGASVFYYTDGQLYRIYCKPGNLTDIQLQDGESVTYVGVGDTVRWTLDKASSGKGATQQWHLYIKPLKEGLKTNLIINTDKHCYQMEIVSTDFYNPMIAWSYPQEDKAWYKNTPMERFLGNDNEAVKAPEDLNFKYSIASNGKYDWSPTTVYDNGKKTFIKLNPSVTNAELPALFIKDKDGLKLVNYRYKENCFIVDRLFDTAELRIGDSAVTITKDKNK
ncbi:MAG: P-type conjugative transfer protein TrbG [Patescibacteria group bacterium]|jgi:type IV secretion system protein VirB9